MDLRSTRAMNKYTYNTYRRIDGYRRWNKKAFTTKMTKVPVRQSQTSFHSPPYTREGLNLYKCLQSSYNLSVKSYTQRQK